MKMSFDELKEKYIGVIKQFEELGYVSLESCPGNLDLFFLDLEILGYILEITPIDNFVRWVDFKINVY